MMAFVQHTYGPPEVLSPAELPTPRLGPRDVLVRVHASDVTEGDRRLRSGDFPGVTFVPGRLAMGLTGPRRPVPGTTFSGVVAAVGAGVQRFAEGDEVFGECGVGGYAEYLALDERGAIAAKPKALRHEEAAALPYGAVTALVFLRDLAAVQPGHRVCVLGGAGGVGRYAVQIARHLGAEVTAVASAHDQALVRSLGAERAVDYRTEDFRAIGPYDVIFDTANATGFHLCRGALTPRGRYLSLIVSVRLLLQVVRTSFGSGQRAVAGVALASGALLQDVAALAEAGALRPVLDRRFAFSELREAHAYQSSRRARGSVVVSMDLPVARAEPAAASSALPGRRPRANGTDADRA